MRYLIVFVVRLYWAIIPRSARRHCIFRESCSCFVMRAAQEEGFKAAVSAFRIRVRQCRPGYVRYAAPDGIQYAVLADHTIVLMDELRNEVFD